MLDRTKQQKTIPRRRLLQMMGVAGGLSMAGCIGSGGNDSVERTEAVTMTSTSSFAPVLEEDLIGALEEDKGITLEAEPTPAESAGTRNYVMSEFAINSAAFDVGMMDVIWPAEFIQQDAISPIEDTEGHVENMIDTPVDAMTFDGDLYGIPIFTDANMLYYRTDFLEEAGYDSPPETYQELINMAQTVLEEVDDAEEGYIWQGGPNEGLTIMWLNWLWGMDGSVRQDGDLVVNSDMGVAALQHAVDLIHEHDVTPDRMPETGTDGNRQTFQSGGVVFMRNWPYAYGLFQDDTPVTDSFDVAPMPSHEDTPDANNSCLGGWNAFVNQFSLNKQKSTTVANWMGSLTAQEIMAAKHARLPVREELYEDSFWADSEFEKPGLLDTLADILQQTRARPATATYPLFSNIVNTQCNEALRQNKEPQEALDDAQEQIDNLIN